MKRHRPAGDESDDRKAAQRELIEAKSELGKLDSARASNILKEREEQLPISVPTLQGGRPESNRRKF